MGNEVRSEWIPVACATRVNPGAVVVSSVCQRPTTDYPRPCSYICGWCHSNNSFKRCTALIERVEKDCNSFTYHNLELNIDKTKLVTFFLG